MNYKYLGIQVGETTNDYDFKIIPTSIVNYQYDSTMCFSYYDTNGGADEIASPKRILAILRFMSETSVVIKSAYVDSSKIIDSNFLKIRRIYGINKF